MKTSDKQVQEVAIGVAALAAGYLLKKVFEESYEAIYHKEPPNAVKDEKINWLHVAGWSLVSGVSATLLKVGLKRWAGKHISP